MRIKLHRAKVLLQRRNDVALVTGDGRTLPDDLERFLGRGVPHDVISIGRSINFYPGTILHWANVDGNESKWWAENLPLKNRGVLPIRHSLGDFDWYDVDWDDGKDKQAAWYGSSALFAVLAALEMGYQRIVMAGCPMDGEGHWFYGPEIKGPEWRPEDYQVWIDFARTDGAKRVKSLSGFTKEILCH